MANYSYRRDETVATATLTFRSVASERDTAELLTAVDPGPTVVPERGVMRSAASTADAVAAITPLSGKAYRSDEVVTAAESREREVHFGRVFYEVITAVDIPDDISNLFKEQNESASAVDDLDVGFGKWYIHHETVTAEDAALQVGSDFRRIDEAVTAVDDVHISIQPRPGVGLVLRPFRNGTDQNFSLFPDSGERAYENVDDLVPDDGVTYVYNSSDPGEAVTFQIDPVLIPVASPQRITGVWLLLRVQGVGATFKPRYRLHNWMYDGEELAPAGADWQSFYVWQPQNPWGWRAWTSSDLLDLEVGLVNTGSTGISLTQVMVWVCTEPTPHRSINLSVTGRFSEWTPSTEGSATYGLLLDDADRSYITSANLDDRQTVRSTESILLPEQFQINKVQLNIRARGDEGTITPLVYEEGIEHPGPFSPGPWQLSVDDDLDVVANSGTWKTWQVPFYGRPSFALGMTRWTLDDILAAEWGVKNASDSTVQVSHVGLDVFASLQPEAEDRLLPTSNGYYQEWNIQAPNSGEDAYQDVNTYLPLDNSYLRADATVTSKLVTFQITNTLEENWYGIRWRARMRREPGTTARVRAAPLLRKNGTLYVGRPLEFTEYEFGTDGFVELVEDFWCSPWDGKPWAPDALQTIEVGVILLEGRADLSWCVLEAGSVPPREHGTDAWVCEFTDVGAANVARAVGDSLIWTVDRYQVGRGGYQADNPAVVHPVETSDIELADLLYTGRVIKSTNVGWTAVYWIALPPAEFSDPIGEIFLMARIVSSNNPADTPGDYFPLAVAHFPCGFHTLRSIRVFKMSIAYSGGVPFNLFGFGGVIPL